MTQVNVKKLCFMILLIIPLLISVSTVMAKSDGNGNGNGNGNGGTGKGILRIDPPLPTMLDSPADFRIYVQQKDVTVYSPHIFLVMTEACRNGLKGPVTVAWSYLSLSGTITINTAEWTKPTTKKIPPSAFADYTVSSLKDHLGTSSDIYYAFKPFSGLSSIAYGNDLMIIVTLPSSSPRMLVYALGKSTNPSVLSPSLDSDVFDVFIPPTIAGFVVPEPMTIAAVAVPIATLIGYKITKKKIEI